jgi:hypothetical protein
MAGANETDHRFLGLDVDEVSLVDTPANEEEWLVIKRTGGTPMATKDTDKNTEPEAKPAAEDQATEAKPEAEPTQKDEPTEPEAKPEAEPEAEPTSKEMDGSAANALLKKLWMMLGEAMGEMEGEMDEGAEAAAKSEPTKKSLMGLTDDGELIINAELLKDVQKAKAFTGKRVTAVANAIKAMMDVLQEVDPSAVKKLVEAAPTGTAQPVKKSTEPETQKPDVTEVITEAVTKALSPLDDRLKALEGARGEPKSSDGDQVADITKRDDNKAIFAGVI